MSSQSHPHEAGASYDRPAGMTGSHHHRGINFWGMLYRRKWLILLMLAIGVGLGYLQFLYATPVFMSNAKLQVTKSRPDNFPIRTLDVDRDTHPNLETQMELIRSPRIVDEAVATHKLSALESLAGKADPTKVVISGLSAHETTAEIMEVRYVGPNAADCRAVLDAVVKSYRTFLEESHERSSNELVGLIHKAKDDILEKLTRLEAEFRQFQAKNPYIFRMDDETQNVYRSRMAGIEEARAQLFLKHTTLSAEKVAIEKALAEGGSRAAIELMVSKLAEQSSAEEGQPKPVAAQLFPMLLDEQLMLDKLGPDHPKVQELQKKIALTRQFLQNSTDASEQTDPAGASRDFIEIYVDSLAQQIKVSELQEQEFSSLLKKEHEKYQQTQEVEGQYQNYRDRIADYKKLFDTIVQRLSEIELVKDIGGYQMQEVSPAEFGSQIAPSLPRFLTVGGILGALVGVVFSLVREVADHRFAAPEDVHLQIGAPVIGHVPDIPEKKQTLSRKSITVHPTVCTLHQPRSQFAEAFRAVRTALYFSSGQDGHKVIQITSPKPGDGKSTLAANLAVSVANSGKQVLLVDADFRRPRIHELLGLENANGLACTIAKGDDLDPLNALQNTDVPNLFCLTCGLQPENPSELLSSSEFERFLELVRSKYDYVIIDSPPVLVVTDPCNVAARVDGVIMTIRLSKHSRQTATQAAEMLKAVGANLIGVVINGYGQGGGYGNEMGYPAGYRSYQYGYAYGYGYGYRGKDAEGYYANGAHKQTSPNDTTSAPSDVQES